MSIGDGLGEYLVFWGVGVVVVLCVEPRCRSRGNNGAERPPLPQLRLFSSSQPLFFVFVFFLRNVQTGRSSSPDPVLGPVFLTPAAGVNTIFVELKRSFLLLMVQMEAGCGRSAYPAVSARRTDVLLVADQQD